MKLDDKKAAYEIQNAADDIRKALELDPTNVRAKFDEGNLEEDHYDYGPIVKAIMNLAQREDDYWGDDPEMDGGDRDYFMMVAKGIDTGDWEEARMNILDGDTAPKEEVLELIADMSPELLKHIFPRDAEKAKYLATMREKKQKETQMETELERILNLAGVVKEAPEEVEETKEEKLEEAKCGCCGNDPCDCADDCSCKESVNEAKVDEDDVEEGSIKYMHSMKKDGKSDEEIGKELNMSADEVKKAMKKTESVEETEETLEETEELEEVDVVEESPTMDTTQLIHLLKLSGVSEEKITSKLQALEEAWGNTPEGVGETEPTAHAGEDNMDFAQMVNLSLKRYLDAQDMKVSMNEDHTVEGMKEKYTASKNK
jgi:biotin operon repressor